jgi:hypothetical protein
LNSFKINDPQLFLNARWTMMKRKYLKLKRDLFIHIDFAHFFCKFSSFLFTFVLLSSQHSTLILHVKNKTKKKRL